MYQHLVFILKDLRLPLSLCGGVGGWAMHSHFHVQPNCSVNVVLWLRCVGFGVVTISAFAKKSNIFAVVQSIIFTIMVGGICGLLFPLLDEH